MKFDEKSIKRRYIYYRLRFIRKLFMAIYISLAIFDRPLWCEDKSYPYSCKVDGYSVPLSGIPMLPQRVTYSVEAFIVLFFICMNFLRNSYNMKSRTSHIRFFAINILCISAIADIIQVLVTERRPYISHFARVILFVIYLRTVRESLYRVYISIQKARYVLVLLILNVFVFGWMSHLLFRDMYSDPQYFHSLYDSLWSMLVLLSTANFPDIMIPAYEENQAYCIFFILYLVVGLLVLQRLMLAVIYNDYKNHIRDIVENFFNSERIHDKQIENFGKFTLIESNILAKRVEGFKGAYYNTNLSNKKTFSSIIPYKKRITNQDSHIISKKFSALYNKYSDNLDFIISHFLYELTINIIIIGNGLVYFLIDTNDDSMVDIWCYGQIPINILLLVELLFVVFIIGPMAYMKSLWKVGWMLTILTSFIVLIVFGVKENEREMAFIAMTYIGLIRMWRILKILNCVEKYRIIFNTLIELIPTFVHLSSVILVIFYVFSLIGQELFGGLIYEENSDLVDPLVPPIYIYNNFNDFVSGVVTLFELLIVNNWWVIAKNFENATSKHSRIFFAVYFIMAVLVVFNLFLAFIMDMLDSQMKYQQPRLSRPILVDSEDKTQHENQTEDLSEPVKKLE
jgi:two pore calcium channel protein